MRKVKVGFISPYEAMMPLIDELAMEQDDLQITRAVGNLEAGVALALEMELNGADVLISRGGTAKMIREAVSLPVVEIHISGYDLVRVPVFGTILTIWMLICRGLAGERSGFVPVFRTIRAKSQQPVDRLLAFPVANLTGEFRRLLQGPELSPEPVFQRMFFKWISLNMRIKGRMSSSMLPNRKNQIAIVSVSFQKNRRLPRMNQTAIRTSLTL